MSEKKAVRSSSATVIANALMKKYPKEVTAILEVMMKATTSASRMRLRLERILDALKAVRQ